MRHLAASSFDVLIKRYMCLCSKRISLNDSALLGFSEKQYDASLYYVRLWGLPGESRSFGFIIAIRGLPDAPAICEMGCSLVPAQGMPVSQMPRVVFCRFFREGV